MVVLGGLLIVLALPLLIGYAINPQHKPWLRLGALLGIIGLLLIVIG